MSLDQLDRSHEDQRRDRDALCGADPHDRGLLDDDARLALQDRIDDKSDRWVRCGR